jgi:hypothetical protein
MYITVYNTHSDRIGGVRVLNWSLNLPYVWVQIYTFLLNEHVVFAITAFSTINPLFKIFCKTSCIVDFEETALPGNCPLNFL